MRGGCSGSLGVNWIWALSSSANENALLSSALMESNELDCSFQERHAGPYSIGLCVGFLCRSKLLYNQDPPSALNTGHNVDSLQQPRL